MKDRNSSDRLCLVSLTSSNIIFIEKRKSLQCFSHEDGCFEPVKQALRAACLNCYERAVCSGQKIGTDNLQYVEKTRIRRSEIAIYKKILI